MAVGVSARVINAFLGRAISLFLCLKFEMTLAEFLSLGLPDIRPPSCVFTEDLVELLRISPFLFTLNCLYLLCDSPRLLGLAILTIATPLAAFAFEVEVPSTSMPPA